MMSIKADYPIGANIAELRRSCGLTQDQVLAKLELWRIPISKSRYSKIETDRINVRVREMAALKKIFKCSYSDFFRGMDERLDVEIAAILKKEGNQ